ncbi:MAG: cellulase family glycosylhydrolase [Planctomycetota bacterium]
MNQESSERWPAERARAWREASGWRVGANFLPSTAGNQLEMWQAETFDPETIDRELGLAAGLGMNVMRVYLHDLIFHADADGLFARMDRYLALADDHGIATVFVLLDDCWSDAAALGPQPEPIPGVHNSTWLRCPADRGVERAYHDDAARAAIRRYVRGVVGRFRDDPRVLAWDLYNEPGNPGKVAWRNPDGGLRAYDERPLAPRATLAMVGWVFDWAREVGPRQPLTVCVWAGDWANDLLNLAALQRSDVVTFHCYGDGPKMRHAIDSLVELAPDRPMMCTEYMARHAGSTFAATLPLLHERGVDAIHWGLVAGRSNTIYPWDSWDKPGPTPEPALWFHDVLRADGSAFDPAETELIRKLTRA